jgi:hypothetical protein
MFAAPALLLARSSGKAAKIKEKRERIPVAEYGTAPGSLRRPRHPDLALDSAAGDVSRSAGWSWLRFSFRRMVGLLLVAGLVVVGVRVLVVQTLVIPSMSMQPLLAVGDRGPDSTTGSAASGVAT